MNIRSAISSDIKAIADIYNYYILNTVTTFELEAIDYSEMQKRVESIQENYPFLVVEIDDVIVGYAYATRWKGRAAYDWAVESSIYLLHGQGGQGIGKKLYAALLDLLQAIGIKTVIGGISLPNDVSIRLHEKLGFQKVGVFNRVGFKHEKWIDVGYWQLHF